jgi:hypothetical protein
MSVKGRYNLKIFHQFLIENNINEKYLNNIQTTDSIRFRERNNISINPIEFISSFIEKYPMEIIQYSFGWNRSDEGPIFWHNKDRQWRNFYTTRVAKDIL